VTRVPSTAAGVPKRTVLTPRAVRTRAGQPRVGPRDAGSAARRRVGCARGTESRGLTPNAGPGLEPRVVPLAAATEAMADLGVPIASRGCPAHHPAPAARRKDAVYRTDTYDRQLL